MKRNTIYLLIAAIGAVCFLLPSSTPAAPPEPAAARVDFNRDVRPVLSDNCFACHGPDENQRQAGLRLDTKEGAFADRGGYQVIVPGKAADSRLFQRVSHEQEVARMPPPQFEKKPGPEQIDTIRRWIDQGAEWQEHWAYVAPARPDPPQVQNETWARNPIDRFVLKRLEREGLQPSAEAAKATLLRRVTFDLTGLPPTPEEVDAFLNDDAPDAYEKRVDQLLQSPHYGERMAMKWLDQARYADTHGYHIDSHRDMWHWRDWVINAFNSNMPFDRFTIEQLAGDLLPNPTREQLVATGFNRNHMINYEGGAIPEEYHTEYVIDRLDTTATVWLSMTMGCGRCHDHKYDPITQKDFYRFFAFFNNIPEKGLDGQRGNAQPLLQLPTPSEESRLSKVKREIESTERKLPDDKIAELLTKWQPGALDLIPTASGTDLLAHYPFEDDFQDASDAGRHAKIAEGSVTYNDGQVNRAVRFSGTTHAEFANEGALDDGPFSLALWMSAQRKTEKTLIHKMADSDSRRGVELYLDRASKLPELKRGQTLYIRLVHQWPDNAIRAQSKQKLVLGESQHVTLSYDGSGKAKGLKLYVDGKPWELRVTHDNLSGSFANGAAVGIGDPKVGRPFKGDIDDLRIYDRVVDANEARQLAVDEPIRAILAERLADDACAEYGFVVEKDEPEDVQVTPKKISKQESRCRGQNDKLRHYYLGHYAPKRYRKAYDRLLALRDQKKQLDFLIPTTMVMKQMSKPRMTHVLGRGDYRNKRDAVSAGVPGVLPPLPPDAPPNRLGLAKWLVDPSNPLTARVAVNRYWQMYFGTGIVKTSEDFGSQGEAPSHPALLDWLATEFVESGWDVKAMQRQIVTSTTYRQSSRVTPELHAKDSENRLLARGARFRLDAEVVRDNALAAAGLLNREIGGASVYPYQPPGLWEEMSFGDRFTAQEYTPSHGQALYRRSMYTFWKRTVPPAQLATFDAPDREKCTVRRARTNTPLQALILMNDPTYVEAARVLAEKMIAASDDSAARLAYAFRRAVAREPTAGERDVLLTLFHQQLEEYRGNADAARDLLAVGESKPSPSSDATELAAWTMVASTVLNLDETITKE